MKIDNNIINIEDTDILKDIAKTICDCNFLIGEYMVKSTIIQFINIISNFMLENENAVCNICMPLAGFIFSAQNKKEHVYINIFNSLYDDNDKKNYIINYDSLIEYIESRSIQFYNTKFSEKIVIYMMICSIMYYIKKWFKDHLDKSLLFEFKNKFIKDTIISCNSEGYLNIKFKEE